MPELRAVSQGLSSCQMCLGLIVRSPVGLRERVLAKNASNLSSKGDGRNKRLNPANAPSLRTAFSPMECHRAISTGVGGHLAVERTPKTRLQWFFGS